MSTAEPLFKLSSVTFAYSFHVVCQIFDINTTDGTVLQRRAPSSSWAPGTFKDTGIECHEGHRRRSPIRSQALSVIKLTATRRHQGHWHQALSNQQAPSSSRVPPSSLAQSSLSPPTLTATSNNHTVSAAKTSTLSLLVKSPFWWLSGRCRQCYSDFLLQCAGDIEADHTDSGIDMDCTDRNTTSWRLMR